MPPQKKLQPESREWLEAKITKLRSELALLESGEERRLGERSSSDGLFIDKTAEVILHVRSDLADYEFMLERLRRLPE